MIIDRRSVLSNYINHLLSLGRVVFTAQEAEQALGIDHGAFLDAAERLQHRKALLSPRHGFYVIVPPQYASWGAPPPTWYIDALMRHSGQAYYVGLLKAAELHGATHQAVMEFQIISDKRSPRIRAGRNLIAFYFRKEMAAVETAIEECKTDTGMMKVSSAALTAFDLLRYPQASGGIDNIATVLSDLGGAIDSGQLQDLSTIMERPVTQRLGYLLDRIGHGQVAESMHASLQAAGTPRWTELDPKEASDPDFATEPLERNARWGVIVRRIPEVDE